MCRRAPDRDTWLKLAGVTEQMMAVSKSVPLPGKQDLTTVKQVIVEVRSTPALLGCHQSALSKKELHDAQAFAERATKWADTYEAQVAAEEKARAEIVLPLCRTLWMIDTARACIAHERSNPSGVVDLKRLHDCGEDMQQAQSELGPLRAQYAALRGHAFTGWQSEGVCVAEVNRPSQD
jgi:hypothetical protein